MVLGRLLILLSLAAAALGDKSYVLKPVKDGDGDEIALVLIQGAQCDPNAYRPLAEKIQETATQKLWIGVPEYVADVPEPLQFGSKFEEIVSDLKKQGMSDNTPIVLAAHSLGAVMAQSWTKDHGKDHGVEAQILFGATMLRKYRNVSYPIQTLTVDGTLDGLLHVTRQAEAYYHQVLRHTTAVDQPVVIFEGLNHWSFASGTPPSNVKSNDLKSEVSEEDGHVLIANIVSDYITSKMSSNSDSRSKAAAAVHEAVTTTGNILGPVITALDMAGYHYLNGPCESDFPTNPTCAYPKWPDKSLLPRKGPPNPMPAADCSCGSKWVANVAQKMMGGLEMTAAKSTAVVSNKDAFHDVSDVRPFHLPHIFSPAPGTSCNTTGHHLLRGVNDVCTIETTTVSMPIYDSKDTLLDTGLYPVTASEYRTKLKSRQAIWEAAGITNVDFESVDKKNVSICKSINQAAYEWALENAGEVARKRFETVGQAFVFADDVYAGISITGPTWIHKALSYTTSADKKTVSISAPYFATENKNLGDEPYTNTVGYHYCKLLSPARAMEWIYVDGLRAFGGL